MKGIPDLFEFTDGSPVKTEEDWRKRRLEMLELLSRHEYGFTPEKQGETTYKLISTDTKCASGHGVLDRLEITFPTQKGDFTFPVNYFHPTGNKKHLTFILINFRPEPYDKYFPAEEIIDNGFGIAQFYYGDITADANEFTSGIAPMFERRNDGTDWGKIGMWAFAASRVADILLSFPETERLAVIGHSRLGKTALWCGAQDERINFVFSNDSGCSGAAYERIKHGESETIARITAVFPYWFCENYKKFAQYPDTRPFDQHMLLALSAPRFLGVGSAVLDDWADQYSEQLSCVFAGDAWAKIYNKPGFVGPTEAAKIGDVFSSGSVHYHLRDGIHFLGRADWNAYMAFVKSKNFCNLAEVCQNSN